MTQRRSQAKRQRKQAATIAQAELRQYLQQVEVCREHQRLANDLRSRLEQGAPVEEGELSLAMSIESGRTWSLARVSEVLGVEKAKALWDSLSLAPVRRLRIQDSKGNILGWRPRRSVSHAQEISSVEEVKAN